MNKMMYKNHMIYMIFIILSQLFLLVTGQFVPGPRVGQVSVSVDNKIIFIGGINYDNPKAITSDIFYLDFNGDNVTWVEVESQLTPTYLSTVGLGGDNKDLIFVIG